MGLTGDVFWLKLQGTRGPRVKNPTVTPPPTSWMAVLALPKRNSESAPPGGQVQTLVPPLHPTASIPPESACSLHAPPASGSACCLPGLPGTAPRPHQLWAQGVRESLSPRDLSLWKVPLNLASPRGPWLGRSAGGRGLWNPCSA